MVGPSSWAALEITSAEPGFPLLKSGGAMVRCTDMTDDEKERAASIHALVTEVGLVFLMVSDKPVLCTM